MNKEVSKVYAVALAYQLSHIKRQETIHTLPKNKDSKYLR